MTLKVQICRRQNIFLKKLLPTHASKIVFITGRLEVKKYNLQGSFRTQVSFPCAFQVVSLS